MAILPCQILELSLYSYHALHQNTCHHRDYPFSLSFTVIKHFHTGKQVNADSIIFMQWSCLTWDCAIPFQWPNINITLLGSWLPNIYWENSWIDIGVVKLNVIHTSCTKWKPRFLKYSRATMGNFAPWHSWSPSISSGLVTIVTYPYFLVEESLLPYGKKRIVVFGAFIPRN